MGKGSTGRGRPLSQNSRPGAFQAYASRHVTQMRADVFPRHTHAHTLGELHTCQPLLSFSPQGGARFSFMFLRWL